MYINNRKLKVLNLSIFILNNLFIMNKSNHSLQLQVKIQANQPQHILETNGGSPSPIEDDIDAALNNLQTTLEGSSISTFSNDITQVPELRDQLRFLK